MGKDKSEKKIKKEKRSDADGVTKKSKKDKKRESLNNGDVVKALEAEIKEQESAEPKAFVKANADVEMTGVNGEEPRGALVPFANPLVEDVKELKKVLRTVKKCKYSSAMRCYSSERNANSTTPAAKTKTLRRGVKEVVKALRKSDSSAPASSDTSNPSSVVIIAADISPMDVISHIPVLCEDHNVPYVYVKSRAELGEASATKRPTSVVMVAKERSGKKAADKEGMEEFGESFGELVKVVNKAARGVSR
jgi:H/ACA ribonucleoprotein complex subunit 2